MAKASTAGLMDQSTRATGLMENSMVKAFLYLLVEFRKLVFGKMANALNG